MGWQIFPNPYPHRPHSNFWVFKKGDEGERALSANQLQTHLRHLSGLTIRQQNKDVTNAAFNVSAQPLLSMMKSSSQYSYTRRLLAAVKFRLNFDSSENVAV
jgi:hypothetical protein